MSDKKNLPIKIFQKRVKVDEKVTEGLGGTTLPRWANLTEDEYSKRLSSFVSTLDTVSENLQKRPKQRDFIPQVVQLELNELATAKSYRGGVSGIFNVNGQQNIIGFKDEKALLVKIDSTKDLEKI